MKANNIANIVIGLCALSVLSLSAQPFSSGSDGSYGPLNVTSNIVLDLPPDGKFNCTTIDVAPNVTLSFRRNALNTPVYLLATSNVIINGVIDVSGMSGDLGFGGAGGPGGFDGGQPSNGPGTLPGDGLGPGAGRGDNTYAGSGSYGSTRSITNSLDGATYGNTLILPLIGGSGGGGGQAGLGYYGGGGGGGAILIASDTSVNIGAAGAIVARGGAAKQQGFGSGGAVRVVAPLMQAWGESAWMPRTDIHFSSVVWAPTQSGNTCTSFRRALRGWTLLGLLEWLSRKARRRLSEYSCHWMLRLIKS